MNKFNISMRHESIGAAHDPYLQQTLDVTNTETGARAVMVENGLGLTKLTLYAHDGESRAMIFERSAYFSAAVDTKTRIWFQRHVGISPIDAREEFDDAERKRCARDPFGGRDPFYGQA